MTPPRRPSRPVEQSSRDKMRSAVSDLMDQVKAQRAENRAEAVAARARLARKRRMRVLQAVLLAVVFLISLAVAVPKWRHPFAAPAGEAARHDARRAIVFASQLIEQRSRATGHLPLTFSELGVVLPGIEYQRSDSSYTLTTVVEGLPISFRRGEDEAGFLATR